MSAEAVHNAVVLEFVARLAAETLRLNPDATPMQDGLRDKHFFRKHGPAPITDRSKENKRVQPIYENEQKPN